MRLGVSLRPEAPAVVADYKPCNLAVALGQEHPTGRHLGLSSPRIRPVPVEKHDLVVGRLGRVRLTDRLAPGKRPDRDPFEDELRVLGERRDHRAEVARPNSCVEPLDVLADQAQTRTP
jgi:hypothetical protein